MALNPKRERFCQEFLLDCNGAAAARRAGYSERTAHEQAAQLLAILSVQERIAELQRQRAERVQVTADDVLRELKYLAFSSMKQFAHWGPAGVRLRDASALTPEESACVAEVSQTVSEGGGAIRFKLHSKTEALQLLGKHLGMFKEQVEHSGTLFVVELVEEVVDDHHAQAQETNGQAARHAASVPPE